MTNNNTNQAMKYNFDNYTDNAYSLIMDSIEKLARKGYDKEYMESEIERLFDEYGFEYNKAFDQLLDILYENTEIAENWYGEEGEIERKESLKFINELRQHVENELDYLIEKYELCN